MHEQADDRTYGLRMWSENTGKNEIETIKDFTRERETMGLLFH